MDYTEQCPTYDDYGDTISHYVNRLHIAMDQIDEASRYLVSIETLADSGWKGTSGDAFIEKIQELRKQLQCPSDDIDSALVTLGDLSKAIQATIESLTEEWRAKCAATSETTE